MVLPMLMAQTYHCTDNWSGANTFLRCDDPVSYTNSNGIPVPAPTVMSTHTLDWISSYLGTDTSNIQSGLSL